MKRPISDIRRKPHLFLSGVNWENNNYSYGIREGLYVSNPWMGGYWVLGNRVYFLLPETP
jgi:hypothetical protein